MSARSLELYTKKVNDSLPSPLIRSSKLTRNDYTAQNAQNIFESVISLGTGGSENGLYHTK